MGIVDDDDDDDVIDLIDEIALEGFEDREHAARALMATVAVLREHLAHDEARMLARALPDELPGHLDLPSAKHLSSGRAREERQVVCAAIGRHLTDEEREAVARALPPDIAADLRTCLRSGESSPRENSGLASGRSLATGRPGSHRPLSEARADRAHSQSVAREDDPHRDTKLSSARGLTQEREHDSLADYRRSRR